jgi:hypothetical protein
MHMITETQYAADPVSQPLLISANVFYCLNANPPPAISFSPHVAPEARTLRGRRGSDRNGMDRRRETVNSPKSTG